MRPTHLSRRTFLQASLAAPLLLRAGRSHAQAPSERINVGCIGVGDRGTYLLQSLLELPEARVTAVCDVKRDRREAAQALVNKTYGNTDCQAFNNFEELLALGDIDACTVASCDHWHVLLAVNALKAGKAVYVEKPLGISIEQGQILHKVVKETKGIFQFGTQQRSDKRFHQACQMVRNGIIGELKNIYVWAPPSQSGGSLEQAPPPETLDYERWLGPAPKVPYTVERDSNKWWWFNSDYAIGFISGWGIHPVDIALWGAGDLCRGVVTFRGSGVYPTEGFCNTATAWDLEARYEAGAAVYYRDAPSAGAWKAKYHGETDHGTVFEGSEGWVQVDRRQVIASNPALLEAPMPANAELLPESMHHMKNFLECVKTRKQPISDIDSAIEADAFCIIADMALRMNKSLVWNQRIQEFRKSPEANARKKVAMREPWKLRG